MPLVLVHNDVVSNPAHQWDDLEGIQYHYPSKYRKKIVTGEQFVYYRGVHRADGKRGPAEYVGSGRIGNIWPDQERKNAWYCSIVNYDGFKSPVLAKVDGVNREDIAANLWRDGVRILDRDTYEGIIAAGSLQQGEDSKIQPSGANLPVEGKILLPPSLAKKQNLEKTYRLSRRSKEIGDWAEHAALLYLQTKVTGCKQCVHRAAIGETPGWDIDYLNAAGELQRVEVKGTVAAAFAGIDLTANELDAAIKYGASYWVCLVANCETASPKIQLIQNPAGKLREREWTARPICYSIRFSPQ